MNGEIKDLHTLNPASSAGSGLARSKRAIPPFRTRLTSPQHDFAKR